MVDIQTVSIAIASATVFAAAIYYIFQIRHLNRARKTDLFMKVYSIWGSGRFSRAIRVFLATEIVDYDGFIKKYGPSVSVEPKPPEIWEDIDLIGTFFNEIGFLVDEKLISEKAVYKFVGY